ncbi:MAG: GWxTD domain-containing protein [Clostridiales bacterium]|nr:GWxTD domain-containing protein [Clostridiales bacterium]
MKHGKRNGLTADMLKSKPQRLTSRLFFVSILGLTGSLLLLSSSGFCGEGLQAEKKPDPLSKYSRQWLEEVVPYIITPEERSVFLSLPDEEERGRFIENFWRKRDPKPETSENEFKLEYFKRIALANKLFGQSGIEGWRTDRGKIFILLGPPHEIQRDMNPSRASLTTFQGPSETWGYWGLQNPRLPYNMEFVFVDKLGTGSYILQTGLALEGGISSPLDISSLRFYFDHLENLAEAMRNPFENLDKLRGIVTTQVSYDLIPLKPDLFYFKASEKMVHIPLVVDIPYSRLTKKEINHEYYFSLTLVLSVQDTTGSVLFEKSKDINFKHNLSELTSLTDNSFQLQTSLSVTAESEGHKLCVLAVDNFSGKIGTSEQEIRAPNFNTTELCLSDILLFPQANPERKSERQETTPALETPAREIRRTFRAEEELSVYFEVYNLGLDETKGQNDLAIEYSFLAKGKSLVRIPRQHMDPSREKDCRVHSAFRLKNFELGSYTLEVTVIDGCSGKSLTKGVEFTIIH